MIPSGMAPAVGAVVLALAAISAWTSRRQAVRLSALVLLLLTGAGAIAVNRYTGNVLAGSMDGCIGCLLVYISRFVLNLMLLSIGLPLLMVVVAPSLATRPFRFDPERKEWVRDGSLEDDNVTAGPAARVVVVVAAVLFAAYLVKDNFLGDEAAVIRAAQRIHDLPRGDAYSYATEIRTGEGSDCARTARVIAVPAGDPGQRPLHFALCQPERGGDWQDMPEPAPLPEVEDGEQAKLLRGLF